MIIIICTKFTDFSVLIFSSFVMYRQIHRCAEYATTSHINRFLPALVDLLDVVNISTYLLAEALLTFDERNEVLQLKKKHLQVPQLFYILTGKGSDWYSKFRRALISSVSHNDVHLGHKDLLTILPHSIEVTSCFSGDSTMNEISLDEASNICSCAQYSSYDQSLSHTDLPPLKRDDVIYMAVLACEPTRAVGINTKIPVPRLETRRESDTNETHILNLCSITCNWISLANLLEIKRGVEKFVFENNRVTLRN